MRVRCGSRQRLFVALTGAILFAVCPTVAVGATLLAQAASAHVLQASTVTFDSTWDYDLFLIPATPLLSRGGRTMKHVSPGTLRLGH
jgi:hypothetical protein